MLRLAVCVSGGGTNLQALIDGINNKTIKNAEIVMVFSNNPGAYALERARNAGIEAVCRSPKDYPTRDDFNREFLSVLKSAEPDLIVLAGCLLNIPPAVVEAFPGRIINIHPSLIPSFCGKGFYGLHVHEKVLERGVRVTGATVHFVDEGTDTGPIILQKAVMIRQDDTPESLQRRVMEEAEWKILPMAVDLIAAGRVSINDGHVVIDRYEDIDL
ncbi:phosphoribosylglycinamide formyltransferase [Butyrivibrio sp. MC2013]|uniref:phosphoribosylglycinamide formyltransferase n=1 Tax=Butyrivibrio sp. MC2013 TaxID=1280686 RepID=UPI00041A68C6|nr:phosphoribosylglycinamide formyltransferase [Butyrivibrio sp. MC2013]